MAKKTAKLFPGTYIIEHDDGHMNGPFEILSEKELSDPESFDGNKFPIVAIYKIEKGYDVRTVTTVKVVVE